MKNSISKILHLITFFVAMAMLESAVVIYLRELLYPNGFQFPMVSMHPIVILTELTREFATIVMLWTISYVAGRNFSTRFAWFLIGFAIWDIFYYVFLYIFIDWPATIWDWDILFLIPLPWYGPVVAPCLISFSMILLGAIILYIDFRNKTIIWRSNTLILMTIGCIISLWTFMGDFVRTMPWSQQIKISEQIITHSSHYIPTNYNYLAFGMAMLAILAGIFLFYKDNIK